MRRAILLLIIVVLTYTRFVGIGWGMPYPMHPDERNMAKAVQSLNCNFKFQISNFKLSECLNPHFFAYGQFPLYIAYGGIQTYHLLFGLLGQPTYVEATIALRTISTISSILLVFVLMKIIELIHTKLYAKRNVSIAWIISFLFLIFQPYAIQLSHFGTTESILMLFYALIIYFSLKLVYGTTIVVPYKSSLSNLFFLALFSGLALGTKVSSLLFLGVPLLVIVIRYFFYSNAIGVSDGGAPRHARTLAFRGSTGGEEGRDRIYRSISNILLFSFVTLFFFILSSPHNILNWNDFISSMTYESRVGLGRFIVFYTRQFVDATPILFQFQKILPFALGWPTLILGILGFFLLPSSVRSVFSHLPTRFAEASARRVRIRQFWSDFGERKIVMESAKLLDILRFSLLLSFLPSSFFFTKWTRFISPSFPLFSLFALLFILDVYSKWKKWVFYRYLFYILCLLLIIPGIAQLSIYTTPDVRFTASEWMNQNIPEGSKILTETANAIDLPIITANRNNETPPKNFLINSFYFYDLDQSLELQNNLDRALEEAEYIIIPTRRVLYNHTCLQPDTLQAGQQPIKRCEELEKTYPLLNSYYSDLFSGRLGFEKIAEFSSFPKISFMGKTLLEFPDEDAEETWTVFDHPVIRIFKKNSKSKVKNKVDYSAYKTTSFQLSAFNFHLLVADTPEKWERGLMYVKNKEDIGGLDGMVFTFPDSQPRTFWNKNTYSHLTLYWLQNKEVIGVSDLPSITETRIVTTVSSPSLADTVIEIIE
jgi:uncharacterized membrane protein (UPF0127 family)